MDEVTRQIQLRFKHLKPKTVEELRALNEQMESGDCPYCESGESHFDYDDDVCGI
jgi:hypothetical protein